MNEFQQVIKAYLDQRAQEDTQFADNYAKKGKSIEKCCNYILRQGGAVARAVQQIDRTARRHCEPMQQQRKDYTGRTATMRVIFFS